MKCKTAAQRRQAKTKWNNRALFPRNVKPYGLKRKHFKREMLHDAGLVRRGEGRTGIPLLSTAVQGAGTGAALPR